MLLYSLLFTSSEKNTFFFSLHFVGSGGAFKFVVGLGGSFSHYNELFQQHSIGMLYFSLFVFVFFFSHF
jgi:hypothetical protein